MTGGDSAMLKLEPVCPLSSLSDLKMSEWKQDCPSLKQLDVSHNKLSTMLPLEDAHWLNQVRLDHNHISSIADRTFSGMANLRTLSITDNSLREVRSSWLQDLPRLETLLLDSNNISDLLADTFTNLTQLTRLSLTNNHLQSISVRAGLKAVQSLDVSGNQLLTVPTAALQAMPALYHLVMDNNPLPALLKASFSNLTDLNALHLCHMPEMVMVDVGAFQNLPALTVLRLYNNPRLVYLSPHALNNVSNLRELYLHSSNLAAVPFDLLRPLQALTQFSMYGNPLLCDCNVFWLVSALQVGVQVGEQVPMTAYGRVRAAFLEPQLLRCKGPNSRVGRRVIDLTGVKSACSPSVIALQGPTVYKPLGHPLALYCKGLGIPHPVSHWSIPPRASRKWLDLGEGTILLGNVSGTDSGRYTCNMSSAEGWSSSTLQLKVYSPAVQLLLLSSSPYFLTYTWNGTGSTRYSSDYLLLWRPLGGSRQPYKHIRIKVFMRSYTLGMLVPGTDYEVCLAYEHGLLAHRLSCEVTRTPYPTSHRPSRTAISIITVTTIAIVFTLACVVTMCCRGYCSHRRRRKILYAKIKSSDQNIPLNALYDSQSTLSSAPPTYTLHYETIRR